MKKGEIMKKLILVYVVLVLVGCQDTTVDSSVPDITTEDVVTTTTTTIDTIKDSVSTLTWDESSWNKSNWK